MPVKLEMLMGALVQTAVAVLQEFELGVVKRQAPDVIDIVAQFDVVVALQASGLAPDAPLESELKLASYTVVWASVLNVQSSMRAATIRRMDGTHSKTRGFTEEVFGAMLPKKELKTARGTIPFPWEGGKVSGTAIKLVSFSRLHEIYDRAIRVILRRQSQPTPSKNRGCSTHKCSRNGYIKFRRLKINLENESLRHGHIIKGHGASPNSNQRWGARSETTLRSVPVVRVRRYVPAAMG